MPVTLLNEVAAVGVTGQGAWFELARPEAQPHRAAHFHAVLSRHEVDNGMGCLRIDLRRVRAFEPAQVTRDFDHGHV